MAACFAIRITEVSATFKSAAIAAILYTTMATVLNTVVATVLNAAIVTALNASVGTTANASSVVSWTSHAG